MTQPLPADGPDRQIFLRALRDYSDNCEAPNLTPGCPFAVDVQGGGRGCGEECIEILTRFAVPPGFDEERIGESMSVIRRRPSRRRRGPSATSRAFDAKEMHLSDEARSLDLWQSTSLIMELVQMMHSLPIEPTRPLEWYERIESIEYILEERGFSISQLVKGGFGSSVAGMVAILLTMSLDLEDTVAERTEFLRSSWVAAGLPLTDFVRPGMDASERSDSILAILPIVLAWAVEAPMVELASWIPAGPIGGSASDDAPDLTGIWIFDRFTKTFLDQWDTTSLHAEWEWIAGRRASPLPLSQMNERRVPPDALGSRIADLATEGVARSVRAAEQSFYELATTYLSEGRSRAAAAIYDAALVMDPDNAWYHNNRGFCLIPDDPREALTSLDRAAALGFELVALNTANRALALIWSGRFAVALRLIEDGWDEAQLTNSGSALLWKPTLDEPPALFETKDLAGYIARLGAVVGEKVDDEELTRIWRARIPESEEG